MNANGRSRIWRNIMKTNTILCTGLLVLGLLCISGIAAAQEDTSGTVLIDDIQPYNGPIGANSPLYGLKLALEDMDESFTPTMLGCFARSFTRLKDRVVPPQNCGAL
jgi:hypothetical protein